MTAGAHVFVDESQRNGRYLLCAALVAPAALGDGRNLMRSLCQPRQRRLHFKTESDPRRRAILSQLARSEAHVRIYVSTGDEITARAECLTQLTSDLIGFDARRLVIESRQGRDQADRHVIFATLEAHDHAGSPTYEHMLPHEEPLLWIPDAVAWAYGAGGDWRRRVDPMISKVVDMVPTEAHKRSC